MMLVPADAAIYLYATATDMRKSFDGLSGLVRSEFGHEPHDGSLFLFINRRRDRLKALHWQPGGFVLWYKRLESGTFESIRNSDGKSVITLDSTELAMLISGISLQSTRRRKRHSRDTSANVGGRDASAGVGVARREQQVAV